MCALLLQIIEGKAQAHVIMDDPAGNSYLQVQPWALGVGSVGTPGGFYFPGTWWEFPLELWVLLKALLALCVLSWGQGCGQRGCRSSPLSPQNVYAPEEDPELSVQRYERSFEQNEELGLNDMRTEGYEPQPAPGR